MKFLKIAILGSMLAIPVQAQDFDKGVAAYEVGDFATAMTEWKRLAEHGNAAAQYNLGIMYANGQGVPQDDAEAVKWYRMAAKQGDTDAQINLGLMYAYGQGVLVDNQTAHMWFNLGAANGSESGGTNRDVIAKEMTPADISEAQRRARVCMASNYKDCD